MLVGKYCRFISNSPIWCFWYINDILFVASVNTKEYISVPGINYSTNQIPKGYIATQTVHESQLKPLTKIEELLYVSNRT